MMSRLWTALVMTGLLLAAPARAADEPRVILGLYNTRVDAGSGLSRITQFGEMPLNHLGLILEKHNIAQGVPSLGGRTDVRGILMWLADEHVANAQQIYDLFAEAGRLNIPVMIMELVPGTPGADRSPDPDRYRKLLAPLGIRYSGGYRAYTFGMKVVGIDRTIAGFERSFDGPLPPIDVFTPAEGARAILTLADAATRTSPIILGPRGGYIAPGYAIWEAESGEHAQWYVDPFALFRTVFRTETLPAPDPTTLSGRRIYYSQIDGDGWLNISRVTGTKGTYSSEIVLREAIKAYPDLPVTVAPIAAELDPAFVGSERSQTIAREAFALPHVEPGSHTYTHPFQWSFFGPGYTAAKELPYTDRYTKVITDPGYSATGTDSGSTAGPLKPGYNAPRAYGDIPFNLEKEIAGAARYISTFAPPGKPVRVVQWSGDTQPFENAIAAATRAGLVNINGGDTLFDNSHNSYSDVAPYGRGVGAAKQIYASQANENIYTDDWTRNYDGFRHLLLSLAKTEKPRRVAAANVYYHMYSGERDASLRALKEVLDGVSTMEIAPVFTSHYAEIAAGFYTARVEKAGENAWRVHDRGALATIRFDNAANRSVDYARSTGVLGDRVSGGTLYVALDDAVAAPLIVLTSEPTARLGRLVLSHSRWEIGNLHQAGGGIAFSARGFGPGEMAWRTRPGSAWRIEADYQGQPVRVNAKADEGGTLAFVLPRGAEGAISVRIQPADGGT